MRITDELRDAQRLSKRINQLHKDAVENIKRFLIEKVGVGKTFQFDEGAEFTIDTHETGGDFEYVGAIRIVKPWVGVDDFYEIQFTWEADDETNESNWKRLDDYDWDLETFVDAIVESVDWH